jgi:hypothetical protein
LCDERNVKVSLKKERIYFYMYRPEVADDVEVLSGNDLPRKKRGNFKN